MKDKIKNHFLVILFLLTLIIAAFTVVYGTVVFKTNTIPPDENLSFDLSRGWYYMDHDTRVEIPSLPATVENSRLQSLMLYRTLPPDMKGQTTLNIETHFQTLEVFIDGDLIYQHGTNQNSPAGNILGNLWNIIDLPEDASGKLLSVNLTSPYSPGEWKLSNIDIAEKSILIKNLWKSCMEVIVFTLLSLILGLFFLLFALLFRQKDIHFNRQGFFYLSFFILLSTLWVLTDSKLPQLLGIHIVTAYLISFLSFMLMSVPFLLYFRHLTRHGHRLLNILCFLFSLQTLIFITLYLTGTADLVATLPYVHVLMVVSIVSVIILCLREQLCYHNRDTQYVFAGICVLTACSLLSLFSFLSASDNDYSIFFRFGLIAFYILMCYSTLKKCLELFQNSLRVETYRALAYTDTMTGLNNRAAFELASKTLKKPDIPVNLSFIVFDINNLKYVNDNFGHTAGDSIIKTASQWILEIFGSLGDCYRIGGDEFVLITKKASKKQLHSALHQLEKNIDRHRNEESYDLDIASGFAMGIVSDTHSFQQLFREADAKMYTKKRKQESKNTT